MSDSEEYKTNKTEELKTKLASDYEYPIVLSAHQEVVDLGRLEPHFYHSERYLFPVGYKCLKTYWSLDNCQEKVHYLCEVLENPHEGARVPLFRVSCGNKVFESETPTGAWTPIVKKAQQKRHKGKKVSASVSGPDYFGFASEKVRAYCEQLPNAHRCTNYNFVFVQREGNDIISVRPLTAKVNITGSRKRKELTFEEDFVQDLMRQRAKNAKPGEEVDYHNFPKPTVLPANFLGIHPTRPLPMLEEYQYRVLSQGIPAYDGNENFKMTIKEYSAEIYKQMHSQQYLHQLVQDKLKKEEAGSQGNFSVPVVNPIDTLSKFEITNYSIAPAESQENLSMKALLRQMWEVPYVLYLIDIMRNVLTIRDFTVEDFENAMILPSENAPFLCELHVRIIKGPMIDRRAQQLLAEPESEGWRQVIKNKLDSLASKNFEHPWKVNPLKREDYFDLDPRWRVYILKALCDWKLQCKTNRFVDHMILQEDKFKVSPVTTNDGKIYWYFGPGVAKMYVEEYPKRKDSEVSGSDIIRGTWSVFLKGKSDMEEFREKFNHVDEGFEKVICDFIVKKALPDLRAYEIEKESREELFLQELEERKEREKKEIAREEQKKLRKLEWEKEKELEEQKKSKSARARAQRMAKRRKLQGEEVVENEPMIYPTDEVSHRQKPSTSHHHSSSHFDEDDANFIVDETYEDDEVDGDFDPSAVDHAPEVDRELPVEPPLKKRRVQRVDEEEEYQDFYEDDDEAEYQPDGDYVDE